MNVTSSYEGPDDCMQCWKFLLSFWIVVHSLEDRVQLFFKAMKDSLNIPAMFVARPWSAKWPVASVARIGYAQLITIPHFTFSIEDGKEINLVFHSHDIEDASPPACSIQILPSGDNSATRLLHCRVERSMTYY